MAGDSVIGKGPEPSNEKNLSQARQGDIAGARDEIFQAMEQGNLANPSSKIDAFKTSPVNEISKLSQSLTGVDFTTADQTQLTDIINKDMAKAVESVINSGNKVEMAKLLDINERAVAATEQRVSSITQGHADILASLPAAEKLQYEEQVKRLSRTA